MSCNVCCSPYNKTTRAEIQCYIQTCGYTCCKECIRTYFKTVTTEPHCMHCRNKWSLEFCKQSLNNSYWENEYKEHRKNVLAEMMIAKVPEHYEAALRFGGISETHKKINAIDDEIEGHRKAINELYNERSRLRRNLDRAPSLSSRKFIMQCQNRGCRGMLSTQYKCDVCCKFTCPKCFVAKDGDEHECNPDDAATVEELRKNTRPCPNCGCRISKIDGCFGANVPVLLWSGVTKMSQDVAVGDTLVGDDGTPRTVKTLVSGTDQLYCVKQRPSGDSYVVSSKHQLVLYYFGEIVEMEVDEYMRIAYPEDYQGIRRYYNTKILTELDIQCVGEGSYYGWSVDGNQRFLLGDQTVVHNCDQMWCVECKTAFSWSKGTVETGVVHNPHYYQWMRQHGGRDINGGANHHNALCRDEFYASARFVNRRVRLCSEEYTNPVDFGDLGNYFLRFHRYITHMENVYLEPLINNIRTREECNEPIYMYILNQINKQILASRLMDQHISNMKDAAHRDILEALIVVGKQILIDCMREVIDAPFNLFSETSEEYGEGFKTTLIKYKRAIIDYCAYSQIETVKYLMTYNTKKTICIWDIERGMLAHMQFKTRTQMVEHIDIVQKLLKEPIELDNRSQWEGPDSELRH
jgi:hypothetical protein